MGRVSGQFARQKVTYRVEILPDAQADLTVARNWYDRQLAGLGDRLVAAIETALKRVRQMPMMYAQEHRNIRSAGVNGFPFVLYYRIVDELIEVVAILHGSQSPTIWKSRG